MTDPSDCVVCKHVLPDVRAAEALFRTRWVPTSPATKTCRGMLRVAMAELERAERRPPRVTTRVQIRSEGKSRTRRVLALMALVDNSRYGVTLDHLGEIPGYAGVETGWRISPTARRRLSRDLDLVREIRPDVVVVKAANGKPIITLAKYAPGLREVEL